MLLKIATGILVLAVVAWADDAEKSEDTSRVLTCNTADDGNVRVTVNMGSDGFDSAPSDIADKIRMLKERVQRLEEAVDGLGPLTVAGKAALDLLTYGKLTFGQMSIIIIARASENMK